MEKIAVSAWHRPIPRPDRSFVLSWQKTLPMQSSVCRFGDVVEYVLFAMPTTACSYAIYLFSFHRALHRASRPSCVSRVAFSHNHSFCWSCNDQILASVLKIVYYLCSRMPAPVLNSTLWLPTSLYSGACLSGAASPLSRPWSDGAGGVSPSRVPRDTPSLKTEDWMKR